MKLFLVMVFAVLAVGSAEERVLWEKCHITDLTCLRKLSRSVVHELVGGNEQLHANPLDPLRIPKMLIEIPNTEKKFEIKNIEVDGIADISLDDFNFDVPGRKMKVVDSFHLDILETVLVNWPAPNEKTLELGLRAKLARVDVKMELPIKFRHNEKKELFMDILNPVVNVNVMGHPEMIPNEETQKILNEDTMLTTALRETFDLQATKIMERAMDVFVQDLKEFASRVPLTDYIIIDGKWDFAPDE